MSKIEILITLPHPKGDIEKGSIYNLNEEFERYEYKNNKGEVISTVNKVAVGDLPNLFKILD